MASPIASLYASLGYQINEAGLKQFQKSLEKTHKQLLQMDKVLKRSQADLQREKDQNARKDSRNTQNYLRGLKSIQRELSQHTNQYRRVRSESEKLNNSTEVGNKALIKREGILGAIHRKYQAINHSTGTRIGGTGARSDASHFGGGGFFAGGLGQFAAAGAALYGASAAISLASDKIQQSSEGFQRFERQVTSLQGITGDKQSAKALQGSLYGFADYYGVRADELIESYSSYKAQTDTTGVDSDQANKAFEALVAMSKARGLSNEGLSGALRAYSQIAGKGQVMAEELTGQIAERGIPVWSLLAQGMGKTDPEVRKLSEQGKISAQQFFDAIAGPMMEMAQRGGGLDESRQSTQSQQNRLYNRRALSNVNLNRAGLDEYVRQTTEAWKEALDSAQPFFKQLGTFAKSVAPEASTGIKKLGEFVGSLGTLFATIKIPDLGENGFIVALTNFTEMIDSFTSIAKIWRGSTNVEQKIRDSAEEFGYMIGNLLKRVYNQAVSFINMIPGVDIDQMEIKSRTDFQGESVQKTAQQFMESMKNMSTVAPNMQNGSVSNRTQTITNTINPTIYIDNATEDTVSVLDKYMKGIFSNASMVNSETER